MADAKMGVTILFCGHRGVFRHADIHKIGDVNVIYVQKPIKQDTLDRSEEGLKEATHHVADYPVGGFWRPNLGILVVPAKQVTEIKPGTIDKYI